MKEAPIKVYSRHVITGLILMIIAMVCFIVAGFSAFVPNVFSTILFAILAMIFGGFAFSHFEAAVEAKPDLEPPVYEMDLLSSSLKNGDEVFVLLAIHYLNAVQAPHALTRIKVELQRALNIHLSHRESLPDNRFAEMESLLQRAIEPLKKELGAERLSLQAVDVKINGISRPSQGIYLGSVER